MKRSAFIKQTSAMAALSFIPLGSNFSLKENTRPLGLQLFTVRDFMTKDPIDTLKKLKTMGYTDFETYGYDVEKKSYFGYSPTDFKNILTDLALTTYTGHYGLHSLMNATDAQLARYVASCIEGAKALGDSYITWPKLDEAYRNVAGYTILVEKLNKIGKQITEAGLGFCYHNFGYDFDSYGGKTGMDWILEETNPNYVKIEVDFYWVMHAGVISPKDLIAQAPGRFPLWHIKDMDKATKDYTELGNGSIDYTQVLPDPKTAGLERYYIEQGGNFAQNSMKSVADSATFFKANIEELI
jgi:sugar phosphate isomerase/epimerase